MECGGLANFTNASPDTGSRTCRPSSTAVGREDRRGVLEQRRIATLKKSIQRLVVPRVTKRTHLVLR